MRPQDLIKNGACFIRDVLLVLAMAVPLFMTTGSLVAQTFTRIDTGAIVQDIGNSQGSSWADIDNDGNVDLFITNTSAYGQYRPDLLYRNLGNGMFAKVDTGVIATDIIQRSGGGSSWGDYDNDGDLDLCTSVAFTGSNRLYRNNGNGWFVRVTPDPFGQGTADASWVDIDNDGYLDLFACVPKGGPNYVFHNNGDGTFSAVDTGVIATDADYFMSPAWSDIDSDGDLDVFVTTCFFTGTRGDRLFLNHGGGYFTSVEDTASLLRDLQWSPGSSWGDYDNDGFMDAYVTNFGSINHLYHNNGDGTFHPITIDPPEASEANSIGSAWGDFDNDGDLDLFATNDRGFPRDPPPSFRQNLFFRNDGDGIFTRITSGAVVIDGGHACSTADYDNDGDLDIVIVNGSLGEPYVNYLYCNNGNNNSWMNIKCRGITSNRTAIGARIRAKAMINGTAVWQTREIAQMSGCHSNNDMRVHFGFRDAATVDSLIIRWPSGRVDTYTAQALNRFYTATEGVGLVIGVGEESGEIAGEFALSQNYPNPFNPSTTIRYDLPKRSQVTLTVFNTLGQQVATLVHGEKEAGYHEVKFDATGLSSGVYFYRMTAGDYVATKKLLILK